MPCLWDRREDCEVHVELFRTRAAAYVHRTVRLLSALSREAQVAVLVRVCCHSNVRSWLFAAASQANEVVNQGRRHGELVTVGNHLFPDDIFSSQANAPEMNRLAAGR